VATSLETSARRAGANQWAESRLFEILGGWVRDTDHAEARLMLDRHSGHCAWRAAQWWDRLPVLADVDRRSLCAPPDAAAAETAERLGRLETTPARLAGAYRVAMPRLWASYERHASAAGGVADGSTIRILRIVGGDLAEDWREGEALLQSLLTGPAQVRQAAEAVAVLEELLGPPHSGAGGDANPTA
jgi:hypothetical protein